MDLMYCVMFYVCLCSFAEIFLFKVRSSQKAINLDLSLKSKHLYYLTSLLATLSVYVSARSNFSPVFIVSWFAYTSLFSISVILTQVVDRLLSKQLGTIPPTPYKILVLEWLIGWVFLSVASLWLF